MSITCPDIDIDYEYNRSRYWYSSQPGKERDFGWNEQTQSNVPRTTKTGSKLGSWYHILCGHRYMIKMGIEWKKYEHRNQIEITKISFTHIFTVLVVIILHTVRHL